MKEPASHTSKKKKGPSAGNGSASSTRRGQWGDCSCDGKPWSRGRSACGGWSHGGKARAASARGCPDGTGARRAGSKPVAETYGLAGRAARYSFDRGPSPASSNGPSRGRSASAGGTTPSKPVPELAARSQGAPSTSSLEKRLFMPERSSPGGEPGLAERSSMKERIARMSGGYVDSSGSHQEVNDGIDQASANFERKEGGKVYL